MKNLHNKDVVRLEGEIVAQIWRQPRGDDLPQGKQLLAVPKGTVSIGMIYRDGNFTRPKVNSSPVVVVQEAMMNSGLLPNPQPTPQSNNISVTVNGNDPSNDRGHVNGGDEAHHSDRSAPLRGPALQVEPRTNQRDGEPAASAAIHASHGNVATPSGSNEYQPSFEGFDGNNHHSNLVGSTIHISASVDQARFAAVQFIQRQADEVLAQIPMSREIVREAISQTVTQASAELAQCSTEQDMSMVIQATGIAIADYVDRSNHGDFGEDG